MRNHKNQFIPFPILETNRCFLQEITSKNVNEIFQIYSDPDIMKYMQRNPIAKIEEAQELIDYWEKQRKNNKGIRWGVFLISEPEILIGTIALQFWRKSAKSIELGADLFKDHWNKGLSSEFTRKVIDFTFETLDINRIELRCNPRNKASIKISEKLGFSFEGNLREYVFIPGKGFDDEAVYSLLKREYLQMNSK